MWYVYFLESQRHPLYIYVGFTNNVERRFTEHNTANSKLATAPYRPLRLSGYIAVCNEERAKALERYCKGGSGKAFLKKHVLPLKRQAAAKYGASKASPPVRNRKTYGKRKNRNGE